MCSEQEDETTSESSKLQEGLVKHLHFGGFPVAHLRTC